MLKSNLCIRWWIFVARISSTRGNNTLDQVFTTGQRSLSTMMRWRIKENYNKGRPKVSTQRDERNIMRSLPKLSIENGHFTSFDIQNECNLNNINIKNIRNCLHKNGIKFLRSKKKGILSFGTTTFHSTWTGRAFNTNLTLMILPKHRALKNGEQQSKA